MKKYIVYLLLLVAGYDVLANNKEIILCAIVVLIIYAITKHYEKNRYYQSCDSNIYKVDNMTGVEFENYLKYVFEKQGYKVRNTPASNDYGADLILTNGKTSIVVQAKRHKSKIGIKAVQEVTSAISYYKADKGIVVTNNYFTQQAINLSKATGIELIDRNDLIKMTKGA